MRNRIIFSAIIFGLILTGPFWLYLLLLAVGVFIFPLFLEGIIWGIVIDTLYGVHHYSGVSLVFPIACGVAILVILSMPVRERIRLHA